MHEFGAEDGMTFGAADRLNTASLNTKVCNMYGAHPALMHMKLRF